MKDYHELCVELFGTDDEAALRRIAGRLRGGRKKALSEKDVAFAMELQGIGIGTSINLDTNYPGLISQYRKN